MKLKTAKEYKALIEKAREIRDDLRGINTLFPAQYVPIRRVTLLIEHLEYMYYIAEDVESRKAGR